MKIALTYSDDFSFWIFRRGLIKELVSRGHEVTLLSASGPYVNELESLGARHLAIDAYRFISLKKDIRMLFQMYRIFRREKFDIVHNFTVKMNVFGSIAAWLCRVPTIFISSTGIGYYFDPEFAQMKYVRKMVMVLCWIACAISTRVWFINPESMKVYLSLGLLRDPSKAVLVLSSGIDSQAYSPTKVSPGRVTSLRKELSIQDGELVILKLARPVWSKGIKEYLALSKMFEDRDPKTHFLLVGACENDNPEIVPDEYILKNRGSNFQWLRWRKDIKEILSISDVVVHFSYPLCEGVPRAVLEAMAMSKPVIVTDICGCRDIVSHNVNGFIVPPKQLKAAAMALETLISDDGIRNRFGLSSRKIVEDQFEEQIIVDQLIAKLYQFPVPTNNNEGLTTL